MADQPELDIPSGKKTSDLSAEEKEAYRERLREKLKDPEFRKIEGFPIGEDEDILALSDAPYYTACPNPFIEEIIEKWQKERDAIRKELDLPDDSKDNGEANPIYKREPFATDVSEGKNDPIYNAHSYHTKVPHKAIMRYILHYTDPGDIVFDGFCGSGMTGVAAQLCGSKKEVEALNYQVRKYGDIQDENGKNISKLGARKAVLVDLCPAATFIAYNYNTPINGRAFEKEAKRILKEVEEECSWMYETWHPNCDDPQRVKGHINYTVWSDVFLCPHCGEQMIFWDVAINQKNQNILKVWKCPNCHSQLSKQPPKNSSALKVERVFENKYDRSLGKVVKQSKQLPVLINYSINNSKYQKKPDNEDIFIIQKIDELNNPYTFPKLPMMFKGKKWGDSWRAGIHEGITHCHHFYTSRNLFVLSQLLDVINTNSLLSRNIKGIFFDICSNLSSKLVRYNFKKRGNGPVSGTLYIASTIAESNVFNSFRNKLSDVLKASSKDLNGLALIETNSASSKINLSNLFDYIFVDPPFGENLMYSELNFINESWLKVFTKKQLSIESKIRI